MRNSRKYLLLIIGMLILFPSIILPSIQTTTNNNGHDHEDDLHSSYIPCECGNPGCTGNVFTCPWVLGTPCPAPHIFEPVPDNNGIVSLLWTRSYGTTFYKVYRSDEEYGTYELIGTTSSYTYTDSPPIAKWWYYVRAHNDNGDSSASNRVCVDLIWQLIPNSEERNFPKGEDVKLGYTIHTISGNYPKIKFKISENSQITEDVTINLKVDKNLIMSTTVDISSFVLDPTYAYDLGDEGTHQIVIELGDVSGSYKLNYLKVKSIEFSQSILYESERYTPIQYYVYGTEYDEAVVEINIKVPFNNEDFKFAGDRHPYFRSSMIIYVNPDRDFNKWYLKYYYYIRTMTFTWSVICPNGMYLNWEDLDEPCDIRPSYGPTEDLEYFKEIELLLFNLEKLLISLVLPGYISMPINFILGFLNVEEENERTYDEADGDTAYSASWTTGGGLVGWPDPELYKASFLVGWGPNCPLNGYGRYQVQLNWKVEIYRRCINLQGCVYSEEAFPLEGTYYMNFEYAETYP